MPPRENVRDSFFATTAAISKGKTDSSGRVEGYPIRGRLGVMYEPTKPVAREFVSPSQRKVLSESGYWDSPQKVKELEAIRASDASGDAYLVYLSSDTGSWEKIPLEWNPETGKNTLPGGGSLPPFDCADPSSAVVVSGPQITRLPDYLGESNRRKPSQRRGLREEGEDGQLIVQVAGVGENVWSGNGLTFTTWDEAKSYASNLLMRWTGADMARVVPLGTPNWEPIEKDDPNIVLNYRRESRKSKANRFNEAKKPKRSLKETGEWSGDEEDRAWMDALQAAVLGISAEVPEFQFLSVHGFDKYQGPYARVSWRGATYNVWTLGDYDGDDRLWIEDFPVDNTSSGGNLPGFSGTWDEIADMLLSLSESKKRKRK